MQMENEYYIVSGKDLYESVNANLNCALSAHGIV